MVRVKTRERIRVKVEVEIRKSAEQGQIYGGVRAPVLTLTIKFQRSAYSKPLPASEPRAKQKRRYLIKPRASVTAPNAMHERIGSPALQLENIAALRRTDHHARRAALL